MRLDRYHGLGNDYLVLVEGPALHPSLVRALCDRHTGPGGDGVLEPTGRHAAAHGLRIWNPDGSVAEKSGNGLRIFARWLVDEGLAEGTFDLWTGSCPARATVGAEDVEVDMGVATTVPEAVPVRPPARVDGPIHGSTVWTATVVGLGNPHCVVFVPDDDLDAVPWRAWGAELERHPDFPNRTNVQVAAVRGRSAVEVRIWERGAGPTLASGSSACAVAAAGVLTGRLAAGSIEVRMPGGSALVHVGPDLRLTLRAPVERIGRIVIDPGWLTARRRGKGLASEAS
jgi:diaminopimelate epimerase